MMAKGSKCRWGNWIGYIIFPFSIGLRDDPLEHLQSAKRIIDRKKNSFEAALTFVAGKLMIKSLGVQVSSYNNWAHFDVIKPKPKPNSPFNCFFVSWSFCPIL